MLDRRPALSHVVIPSAEFVKFPEGFILQLEIALNFEKVYLFHINSFSFDSSFDNSVIS